MNDDLQHRPDQLPILYFTGHGEIGLTIQGCQCRDQKFGSRGAKANDGDTDDERGNPKVAGNGCFDVVHQFTRPVRAKGCRVDRWADNDFDFSGHQGQRPFGKREPSPVDGNR